MSNNSFEINAQNKVKRLPKRGKYDKETVYEILDQAFVCHVGFVHENAPVVIPTLYGRKGDFLYLHGSAASRMMKELANGIDLSICVSLIDGLVLARSLYNHSMNYRSVVVFGKAELLEDTDEKIEALKVISDNTIPGRWEEAREPNSKELKATKVLKMEISLASAKVRTGPPGDDKPDYDLDVWAGVIPLKMVQGEVQADPLLREGIEIPLSVKNYKV